MIPYFNYAKGDKKDQPRVSIRARVCADAIQVAGIDHSERAEVLDLVGDVGGLNALQVDDFVITGHTLAETARCVMEPGARSVHAAVTHAVFSAAAAQVIDRSPIASLVVTDSVEGHPARLPSRCRVVSVAPLVAEAIRRTHVRESSSVLFDT